MIPYLLLGVVFSMSHRIYFNLNVINQKTKTIYFFIFKKENKNDISLQFVMFFSKRNACDTSAFQ